MDAGGEFSFDKGDSMTVDLGDGDGLATQVQSCETCPPGNPLMFLMMGHVLVGSGEAFAEQILNKGHQAPIQRAVLATYGRNPHPEELEILQVSLRVHTFILSSQSSIGKCHQMSTITLASTQMLLQLQTNIPSKV